MKFLSLSLLAFSLLSSPSWAACELSEAQVLGRVVESTSKAGSCVVALQLVEANNHIFCPLNVTRGERVSFSVESKNGQCPAVGSELSGVLQANSAGNLSLDQ